MNTLLIATPLLPIVAAALTLAIGRRLRWGGGELVLAATALSLIGLVLLPDGSHVSIIWFETGQFRFTVGLEVTRLTWFVAMVVAGTAVGVCLYSLGYMAGKPDQPRFFAEFGLFIGAMLALVLADSLVLLFAAWELVGIASYLLIAFPYDKEGAPEAATKAFLMTRIGDVGLLLGWLLALTATDTTDIAALVGAAANGQLGAAPLTLIAFLVLAGAIGKSAQLPLTGWLPDAMIGPTPVSALIHSATMVAAGVFLILRLYPLFLAAPAALVTLVWIGAATALVAALAATAETDLKRILAWSTSSQLGEMMIALGLGGPLAASFHLATHAAYKSTLFLAAGSVQERTGTTNLQQLGALIRALPLTGGVFVIAALALAGIPPLSGFWSEDAILSMAGRHGALVALAIVLLFFLAGTYIGRATIAVFFAGRRESADASEPGWTMLAGMVLLALIALCLGWLLKHRLEAWLPFALETESGQPAWRLIGIAAALSGLALGAVRAWRGPAPVFGALSASIGPGLMALTVAPAEWVKRLAIGIMLVEKLLDDATRRMAAVVWDLAQEAESTEAFALDGGGRLAAAAALRLADGMESAEGIGFGSGGDRLAANISFGGERLRLLQTGKIYLYTIGLLLWAAAALAAAGLMIWQ